MTAPRPMLVYENDMTREPCAGFSLGHGAKLAVRPCKHFGVLPSDDGKHYCRRHHPSKLRARVIALMQRPVTRPVAVHLCSAYGTTVEAVIETAPARRVDEPITRRQLRQLELLAAGHPPRTDYERELIASALANLRRVVAPISLTA